MVRVMMTQATGYPTAGPAPNKQGEDGDDEKKRKKRSERGQKEGDFFMMFSQFIERAVSKEAFTKTAKRGEILLIDGLIIYTSLVRGK